MRLIDFRSSRISAVKHLVDRSLYLYPCAVNTVVNPTEFLDRCLHHGFYAVFVYDIYRDRDGAEFCILGDFLTKLCNFRGAVVVYVGNDHTSGASFRES